MRLATSILLLCSSTILPGILAQNTDEQVTASYEQTGSCAFYFQKPAKKAPLSQTCIKYCENNGGHGYSECDRSPYNNIDFENGFDKSLIEKDADGDLWVPCRCKCDNPDVEGITEAIFDVVAEALQQLDNVICAVMLESFKQILEIGIDFIPGGAEVNGIRRAVEGAKSFAENGLAAADFFGNWVGKACGVPDWNFDLWDQLTGAPSTFGQSIGCKKKNKADCKKPEERPPRSKGIDPPVSTKPDIPPVSTPGEILPVTTQPEIPPVTTQPDSPPPSTKVEVPTSANTNNAEPTQVSTNNGEPSHTSINTGEPSLSSVYTGEPTVVSTGEPILTSVNTGDPSPTSIYSGNPSPTSVNTVDPSPTSINTVDPSPTSANSQDPSASPTTSPSASSTESCGAATGTQSAAACEMSTPCDIKNPDVGTEDTDALLRRDNHRSPRRAMLERRDKKTGNPCVKSPDYKTFQLSSDEFPSNGKLADDVKAWSWAKPASSCDYNWEDGTKKNTVTSYHAEHVMEWQIVTDFFAKLQQDGGTKYEHPDPRQNKKAVDFCTYWIESWGGVDSTTTPPAGLVFSLDQSAALSPWQHIAAAYPSNTNHKEEFIALQDKINSPAKANLFTDTIEYVWTKDAMDKKVKSDRIKVLERMRYLLGAQKYMTNDKVKEIFKAQKERMGTILDELDTNMSTHVREDVDAQGVKTTYTPWAKQDLLTAWNTHMDTKWDNATKKHKKVMNYFINALDDAHCQSPSKKGPADKDFCDRLRKLQTEYKGTTDFSKPW